MEKQCYYYYFPLPESDSQVISTTIKEFKSSEKCE